MDGVCVASGRDSMIDRDCSRIAGLIVVVVIFISSLPVFLSTIASGGQDTVFHLYRIEGIAQGLRDGQFPVMIQHSQIKGYGYPVSICYGDLFLYLPALLRLLGLSMHASFGLFILCANSFCAISTYIVFKRMFGERRIALLACALWTLSPYRLLIDMYLRCAVGEFLALGFLPIVLYGLYSIVWYKARGASRYGWVWCAMGMAAIVYSHILTVMLTVLMFLPILIFEVLSKRDICIVRGIVFAALATFGLSFAFALPFLDFYTHVDMRVNTQDSALKQLIAYDNALQPVQLFELFPDVALWSIIGPTLNEMPYGIGWSLLTSIPLWGLVVLLPSVRSAASCDVRRLGSLTLVLVLIFMWMTTVYFPWKLDSWEPVRWLISTLATIQFPWRLVGTISFLLVFLLAIGMSFISRSWMHGVVTPLIAGLLVLSSVEAGYGITSFLSHSQQMSEDYSCFDATFGVMNGEYLPASVDLNELMALDFNDPIATSGINVEEAEKIGNSYIVRVANHGAEGYVTVPLLMYPHYHAKAENGSDLSLSADDNGLIRVSVPEGYSGDIDVAFVIPLLWRCAECVSVASFIALVAIVLIGLKRHRICSDISLC